MSYQMWGLAMRGGDVRTEALFCYLSCEARVPKDHPLRPIRTLVDQALGDAVAEPSTSSMRTIGRPSIPPEKLLRALLLQAFYSVRSERQLMEQLDYNLLFRWFVGLAIDAPIWDVDGVHQEPRPAAEGEVAAKFFQAVLGQPQVKALLSDEHFSVDGTLDRGLGQHEELQAQGRGGRRSRRRAAGATPSATSTASGARNATHASTTDPDARLLRKGRGKEAKLCHMGHLLDGEPQRADRRRPGDRGHRHRRARRRAEPCSAARRAGTAPRSAPTRPTTWRTSSPICAR